MKPESSLSADDSAGKGLWSLCAGERSPMVPGLINDLQSLLDSQFKISLSLSLSLFLSLEYRS